MAVILALMLQVQFPLSGSQVRLVLQHVWDLAPNRRTPTRWVRRFSPHRVRLETRLGARFTDVWSIDELVCNRHAHESKRKPSPKYLLTVLDSLRQVVATLVSDRRDADSIERVIRLALERGGIVPRILSRDGWSAYDKAFGRLRHRLRGTRAVTTHFKTVLVPETEMVQRRRRRRGTVRIRRRKLVAVTQNHIERYHGLPRARENSMRGVKNAASGTAYFQALAVASNLFKPHAHHGGKTPAEAAGWSPGLKWADLDRLL